MNLAAITLASMILGAPLAEWVKGSGCPEDDSPPRVRQSFEEAPHMVRLANRTWTHHTIIRQYGHKPGRRHITRRRVEELQAKQKEARRAYDLKRAGYDRKRARNRCHITPSLSSYVNRPSRSVPKRYRGVGVRRR